MSICYRRVLGSHILGPHPMLICTVTLSTFLLTTELERRIFFCSKRKRKSIFLQNKKSFFYDFWSSNDSRSAINITQMSKVFHQNTIPTSTWNLTMTKSHKPLKLFYLCLPALHCSEYILTQLNMVFSTRKVGSGHKGIRTVFTFNLATY